MLWVKVNPFDGIVIPDKYVPTIMFSQSYIERKPTNENFEKSGYKFQSSLYILVLLMVQFVLGFLCMFGAAMVIYN